MRGIRQGELVHRYERRDLAVFTGEERRRFLAGCRSPHPEREPEIAWELLYRLEPEIYFRLARAERLHDGILDWLPRHAASIVEVAAGAGRLTRHLAPRCERLIAIEPAAPLRRRLQREMARRRVARRWQARAGFFDHLPVPSDAAEWVITCAALTPSPAHGGEAGLAEMERVCAPGGRVVIVWPNHPEWLRRRGYRYLAFPGEMRMEFASWREAAELAAIFYPQALDAVRRRQARQVPYRLLGVNAPRDLAWKTKR